jgi:hypothetical protein
MNATAGQASLLADRGYDADWIRELAMKKGAWANIGGPLIYGNRRSKFAVGFRSQ